MAQKKKKRKRKKLVGRNRLIRELVYGADPASRRVMLKRQTYLRPKRAASYTLGKRKEERLDREGKPLGSTGGLIPYLESEPPGKKTA